MFPPTIAMTDAPQLGRLRRSDLVQLAFGLIVAVSVFLPWYGTDTRNPASTIDGRRGDLSAWDVHPVLRWILLIAAISTLLGAWQTLTAQRTELHRGEMTVIVAVFIIGLVLIVGLLNRPGEVAISLRYGWFLTVAAGLGVVATGLVRLPPRRRAPPGAAR